MGILPTIIFGEILIVLGILFGAGCLWFIGRAIYIWWQDKKNGIHYD
jgi:uncharacterized protein YggT (Ycf19 family)